MRAWAQGRIRVDSMASQPLKQVRLFGIDFQVTQLYLGLGPRQPELSLKGARFVILVSQSHCLLARARKNRAEGTTHSLVGPDSHSAAHTKHRIHHAASR